ncbi:uncharacterized protein LOC114843729 [Betta splendens]|uniref:Uncharacterized protein LOC114843729 n=1 Tax=Betta splendens TaxID=158456 RepID=A0A6P7KV68_BETSP|nr:uncharacterized protein LOC114843729 [Betta splendens]
MRVPLVVLLSTVMLHSVSAGGVYCAKTARARAAALGLAYPGLHGAPDLHGPAHNGLHPRPHPYKHAGPEPAGFGPDMSYYNQRYPGVKQSHSEHKQAQPWNSESPFHQNRDTYSPVQSEYAAGPRGLPVSNLGSDSEQVQHVDPRAWAPSSGQPAPMNGQPQGHTEPLPFVYGVPNRRAPVLTALPLTHGVYQRGPARHDFGGDDPVLGSYPFPIQPYAAVAGTPPLFPGWWRVWFPPQPVPMLHRNPDVGPVNPFFRPVINRHQ